MICMVLASTCRNIEWGKVLQLMLSFCLAFTGTFLYLSGLFTVSNWTAIASSATVGAFFGVGVTTSVYFRATSSLFFVEILLGSGRFMASFFFSRLALVTSISNIVKNLRATHAYLNCTTRIMTHPENFDVAMGTVLHVSTVLHYGLMIPVALVFGSAAFHVFTFCQQIKPRKGDKKKTFLRRIVPMIKTRGNAACFGVLGSVVTSVHILDYCIFNSIASNDGVDEGTRRCQIKTSEHAPSYGLFLLYIWFSICFVASAVESYIKLFRKFVLSKFFRETKDGVEAVQVSKRFIKRRGEDNESKSVKSSIFRHNSEQTLRRVASRVEKNNKRKSVKNWKKLLRHSVLRENDTSVHDICSINVNDLRNMRGSR